MPPVVVNLQTPALLMPWSVVVKAVAMHSRFSLILTFFSLALGGCVIQNIQKHYRASYLVLGKIRSKEEIRLMLYHPVFSRSIEFSFVYSQCPCWCTFLKSYLAKGRHNLLDCLSSRFDTGDEEDLVASLPTRPESHPSQ
jgi:hypothetical protein